MKIQATYLIRIVQGSANISDDQAFRCGRFLQLNIQDFDYFLDLVRMDRAADIEVKRYFLEEIKQKSQALRKVKNRIKASPIEVTLSSQIQYYSSWEPSVLHVATSCSKLQTVQSLAQVFHLSEQRVCQILSFLLELGLVTQDGKDLFEINSTSLHLAKNEPLHLVFQKVRREIVTRRLGDRSTEVDFNFSSIFATSKEHMGKLRRDLLHLIEASHSDLATTESEEVALLVIDFLQLS